MNLELPGFELSVAEGILKFSWQGFAWMEVRIDHCVAVRSRPRGQDGGQQLVFQFRREIQESGLALVALADVPLEFASQADQFVAALGREYGIRNVTSEEAEEEPLTRVPTTVQDWLVSPAGAPAEELYADVFHRIEAEPAS
ncbi:hypothetical protein [Streptomyces angustmyceticus]|uniref:hypothetical protein n=1 Tax=Streptomyces angustmyceticus TaxID=285578 RepID=UPI0038309E30